jgi:hypothetical protein
MQMMAGYFVKGMMTLISGSDVKITMNMTFNETKMIDYMYEKLNNNVNIAGTANNYQIPCKNNDCIPKGETIKDIYPQVIGENIINKSAWWRSSG